MSFLNRMLIICVIKKIQNQNDQSLCYIPELVCFQSMLSALKGHRLSRKFKAQKKALIAYQAQYGMGILPMKWEPAKQFIETLYAEGLKNNIPLPENIAENQLKYHIKNIDQAYHTIRVHEKKIKIPRDHLSFFAKHLRTLGTVISYTLTAVFSLNVMNTLLKWGWSFLLISLFTISKLLTNYADISGGPERRMLKLGSWMDRMWTQLYKNYGTFSAPLLALNISVIAILACSSIMTWYGAWCMFSALNGVSSLPEAVSFLGAGVFAWFSVGSSFGRIYGELYQLLHEKCAPYVSFDNVKEEHKIDLVKLSTKLAYIQQQNPIAQNNHSNQQKPAVLHQFSQQARNSVEENEVNQNGDVILTNGALDQTHRLT